MANRNKNVMRDKAKQRKSGNRGKFDRKECFSMDEKMEKSGGPNDLSWYVVDDQILNDAARIPYSIPVGLPFTRNGSFIPTSAVLSSFDDAIPGLCVSYVMPLLGNADNAGDAVNVAANSVYQNVRAHISGSRNYDAVDMMVYLGAMDSIYCFVTWLTRLYSTVFTYHQANRYLSRALIESQNVDYDDLTTNLAQFRAGINLRIAKIKSLYLPALLPIFKRHSWLFSSYYIEGQSEKDQIYFHVPAGAHHFKYDADGAGMLEAYDFVHLSQPFTVQSIFNTLDSLINPVYQDEDFNKISGDFLKTYEGNVFTVTEIPDISTVQLYYSEEVLLQFKNAKYKHIMGSQSDRYSFFDYTQDSNKVYLSMRKTPTAFQNYMQVDNTNNSAYQVTTSAGAAVKTVYALSMYDWSKETLLSSPHKDVTPGESMINTRLTLAFNISGDATALGEAKIDDMYFGSEWPIEYRLYTFHRNKSTGVLSLFFRRYDSHMYIGVNTGSGTNAAIESLVLSQEPIRTSFKYLPELTLIWNNAIDSRIVDPGRSYFEVDNYALIAAQTVGGLHNAAILGEYNIPKLAIGR